MPNRFAASLRLSPSIITACLTLAYSSTVNILPAPPCQSPASERPSRTGTLLRRCHTAAHSRFSGTLCLRDLYQKRLQEYYTALGRFTDMFSQVETAIALTLWYYAKCTKDI